MPIYNVCVFQQIYGTMFLISCLDLRYFLIKTFYHFSNESARYWINNIAGIMGTITFLLQNKIDISFPYRNKNSILIVILSFLLNVIFQQKPLCVILPNF